MKNILYDATPVAPELITGVGRLVFHTVRRLFELDRENRYSLFGFAPKIWPTESRPANFVYHRLEPLRLLGPLAQEAARRHFVRRETTGRRIDLFHATLEMTSPADRSTRVLFSLYDLARCSTAFAATVRPGPRDRLRTFLRYRGVRLADMIHTISQYSAERIAHELAVDPARIRVIHPGVDPLFTSGEPDAIALARFGLEKYRYLLFVGQLGRQKNEEGLIRAFQSAHAQNALPAGISLALAGDDSYLHPALRKAIAADPGRRVRLLGRVADADLLHLYRGAVSLVLPSHNEGFGLPAAEAMACGTPPVVSDTTSLPEVVGPAGLVVPPDDTAQLAEALSRITMDHDLHERLSQHCAQQAAQFTFDRMAEELFNLYNEMTHG